MSMSAVHFGAFRLDPADRRLSRGGETVDLSARYMDALILLVEAGGELVAKDRFMDEVWRGVPVTDEALTQAIRTLRRTLGDTVKDPQYIETVPKYGYRFIAEIEPEADGLSAQEGDPAAAETNNPATPSRAIFLRTALAGAGGAIVAGLLVGLLYGFVGAAGPSAPGGGALSALLVIVLVTMLASGIAGSGIVTGFAASGFIQPRRWYWAALGGALGGVTIGAFANALGQDAFRLLLGRDVQEFSGALEGLILGGAVGLAAFRSDGKIGWTLGIAAMLGAGAGLVIALAGGRMMAGSLQELVGAFPASQFTFDALGGAFGEDGLGPVGQAVTACFEGAVFAACVVWPIAKLRPWSANTNRGSF